MNPSDNHMMTYDQDMLRTLSNFWKFLNHFLLFETDEIFINKIKTSSMFLGGKLQLP